MKRNRSSWLFAVLSLTAMTGCAAATPNASTPAASTAVLSAAELHESDDAPKVGKSQRSDAYVLDDEEGKREGVSHGLDRKHGGFSGYK